MDTHKEPKHDVKFFKEMIDNAIENGYKNDLIDYGSEYTYAEMLGHFDMLEDEDPEEVYQAFLEAYGFYINCEG